MTDCLPRYATAHRGKSPQAGEVAVIASQLGIPLLPWQRQVLSVALERRGNHPRYRDCYVSVPRQSGKSSLALALILWKLLAADDTRVLYSAQSRAAAREKLLAAWWPRLRRSPYADRLKLWRGFGSERLEVDNGSSLQLLSTRESAGHGETCDLAVIDEAWCHLDSRIEQAVRPAMATKRQAQLWAVSTAGNARSVWWRARVDAGRVAAECGMSEGLSFFEWSAPEGANPADRDVWRAAMPALGRTIHEDTVAADMAAMALGDFERAYLNRWPDPAGEGWKVFSEDAWKRACGEG